MNWICSPAVINGATYIDMFMGLELEVNIRNI